MDRPILGLLLVCIVFLAQFHLSETHTATTRYESPHRSGSTYYVLHGGSVTLVCDTGLQQSEVRSLEWSDAKKLVGGQLYNYYFDNEEHNLVNDFVGRNIQYEFRGTEHRLTINSAGIMTDGRLYTCNIRDMQRNPKEGTLDLRGIIIKSPESVTLNLPTAVVEDTDVEVQCSVSSVYPGKTKTDFILKVGSESYTDGEETENVESNGVTYTVTYTYSGEFDRNHQGQQVQCGVTWQENTPVKTVKTSSSRQLNIYYVSDTVTINANSGSDGNVGDTKIMTCTAEANPDPVITLYRLEGSERKKVGDTATSSLSEKITMTKEINRQNFLCTATSSNTALFTYSKESEKKYYTVQFASSSITMSQSPTGAVTENTDVTFTCVTDEAEPTAEVVWTVGGSDRTSGSSNTVEAGGRFNAEKRRSELTMKAGKTRNGETVECHVRGKSEVRDTEILDVRFAATAITMTQSPSGAVIENTDVTFTCVTDEAEPTAEVMWTVGESDRTSDSRNSEVSGDYNAKKRRSELTVRMDRTLNGQTVECHVSGKSEVRDTETLDVRFPPRVTIAGYNGPIEENAILSLTCEIIPGNPETVTNTKYWEFVPKYEGTESQALPAEEGSITLSIEKTVYSDTGRYTCTAGNGVGTHTEEVIVVIYYQPRKLSNETTFYSVVGQSALLNITLRAFPEFSDSTSAFDWTRNDGLQITNGITSSKLADELFYSEFKIESVQNEDFSSYRITVNNGVNGDIQYHLDLENRGVPESPDDISLESVTAVSITLSWMPGDNGGAEQTFTVYYRQEGDAKILFHDGIYADVSTERGTYKVQNLLPDTKYFFRVQAVNAYGESVQQPEIAATTLSMPYLEGALKASIYDEIVAFSWDMIYGNYTSTAIYSCHMEEELCGLVYNITDTEIYFHALKMEYNNEDYVIKIYQDNEEVMQAAFNKVDKACSCSPTASTQPGDNGLKAGLAVVVTVAVILAVTLIVLIALHKKRNHRSEDNSKTIKQSSGDQSSTTYENVKTVDHYEMTGPRDNTPHAVYTDLQHQTYEQLS